MIDLKRLAEGWDLPGEPPPISPGLARSILSKLEKAPLAPRSALASLDDREAEATAQLALAALRSVLDSSA